MYCICCKKNNVKLLTFGEENQTPLEEDILFKNSKTEMVDGGIIQIIDAGYGSKHDGDRFIIAICDDCISQNKEDSTLLYFGNYMYTGEGFTKDEIQQSKQKYRRRKNIDGLV
jgi:hypothetical protein